MLELEKWGASKPDKYIVMIAHDFATGADALYQFLLSTKNRRRPEGYFDLPHVNKWLKFYDKDKTIIDYLISKFKEDEDDLDSDDFDLKELIDQVRALRKGDKYFLAKLEK